MSKSFRITQNNDGTRYFSDSLRARHRGGFKGGNNNNRRGAISFSARKINEYLDRDVNMDGNDDNISHRRGGRGRGTRRGYIPRPATFVPISPSNFYKVTISHALDLDKDFILKSINNEMKIPFLPLNFRKERTWAVFNIKGHNEAVAVKNCHRTITTPSGYKMYISVSACEAPVTVITEQVMEVLRVVLSKRFLADTSALNLANLANDPQLKADDILVSFSRSKMVTNILSIISQNIPQLQQLDLSDNNIAYLDAFSTFAQQAQHLTTLNLSNNKVTHEKELRHLKKLKLQHLWLVNNPIQKLYNQKPLYIRAVRQKFPSLLTLDGITLPPPINFNIDSTELPATKPSYFEDGSMKDVICLFLQQYFSVYDSEDRAPLIGAYHPSATFSLTCLQTRSINNNHHSLGLHEYLRCNRNIKKVSEGDKVSKVWHGGELIVKALQKLPSCLHVPSSFSVDISLVSQSIMIFSVQGLFIETGSKHKRHFNKILVTVPNAEGLAIMNEMNTISSLPIDLLEKHKGLTLESVKKLSSEVASVPQPVQQTPVPGVSGSGDVNEDQKRTLQLFVQQSGMNVHYSTMCLSANQWDFQQAAVKFQELKVSNSIPPEAFIHN